MQRFLLVVLFLAALGAAGYYEREPLLAWWQQAVYQLRTATGPESAAPAAATPSPNGAETATSYTGPRAAGAPQKAAPGTFFMVQRAKVVSGTGVKAVNPGEEVKLLERLPRGRLRVQVGEYTFDVDPVQVTDDLGAAREAERRFHATLEQSL